MKPAFYRKRLLVRPFQYRLMAFQALYFALLGSTLYFCGIVPLHDVLQDRTAPSNERVGNAEALLYFDRHVLPYLLPLAIAIFAHSVLVSHRVAGPLYRFATSFRSIATGDLSMQIRIRPRDYLQEEARDLDQAVVGLRQRVLALREQTSVLERALDGFAAAEAHGSALDEVRAAAAGLRTRLEAFVLEPAPTVEPPTRAHTSDCKAA